MTHSSRFKKFQYNTQVPGPGSYEARGSKSIGRTMMTGRSENSSRVLEVPPPGYYEPKVPSSTKETTSMFRSSTKRMQTASRDNPAPWQYNPVKPKTSGAVTAPFVRPSNRKREQINLYEPHAKPVTPTTPGPGEYKLEVVAKGRPSSMFLATEVDRFGKPVRNRKRENFPGPGEYLKEKDSKTNMVSGAVFLSESKRAWMKLRGKPPGPAFYSPMPVSKKKSFHYTPNKLWI